MQILSPKSHGLLDYVTVIIFALTPNLFAFIGIAAYIAYALAGVHLLMTLLTDFPMGIAKVVPFFLHGWVERIVGPALILAPFLLGFSGAAMIFYIVMGVIIIAVGLLTNYKAST